MFMSSMLLSSSHAVQAFFKDCNICASNGPACCHSVKPTVSDLCSSVRLYTVINVGYLKHSFFLKFPSTEEKTNLALVLLPAILRGRKASKGGVCTVQETLDSFIDVQPVSMS